jgi:hypothetical protein
MQNEMRNTFLFCTLLSSTSEKKMNHNTGMVKSQRIIVNILFTMMYFVQLVELRLINYERDMSQVTGLTEFHFENA